MKWKTINNFSRYSISDTGLVRNNKTGRVLKQCINRDGYLCIGLFCDNDLKQRKPYIHRLVAIAFIINENNLEQVDHIDRNPLNNKVTNLRWVSSKDNVNNRGIFNKTGLYYDEENNEWCTQVKIKNDLINLGCYKTIKESVNKLYKNIK